MRLDQLKLLYKAVIHDGIRDSDRDEIVENREIQKWHGSALAEVCSDCFPYPMLSVEDMPLEGWFDRK